MLVAILVLFPPILVLFNLVCRHPIVNKIALLDFDEVKVLIDAT
jgi:hypothetical protein